MSKFKVKSLVFSGACALSAAALGSACSNDSTAAGQGGAGGASGGQTGSGGNYAGGGAGGSGGSVQTVEHVLLLSVDGLHEIDLANYIEAHPSSALAKLSKTSVTYTNAHTTTPSDSFPGLLSFLTGGTSKSTGVYYDDSYDRTLYPPGSNCAGEPGTQVLFDESIDHDTTQLVSAIDPANLPLAKKGADCVPIYPHDFIKVNTIFEVARSAKMLTAWADKHPAYDLVNGPSGKGVVDLYTPEINSDIANGGTVAGIDLAATQAACDGTNSLPIAKVSDYTTCLPAIEAYDDIKVAAVLNQIAGKKSDGSSASGVPSIFGMNFQAISVGQKLTVGGYTDDQGTPGAVLADALAHTDASIGKLVVALDKAKLTGTTMIILSAKHGQSPTDKSQLMMEAGGSGTATVVDPADFIGTADATVDTPSAANADQSNDPTMTYGTHGHLMADDVGVLWLQDQSSDNISAVGTALTTNAAAMSADSLPPGTIFSTSITGGAALAAIFGDPTGGDPIAAARAPNFFIQPNYGTIYSGSTKKIAEHGGGTDDDVHVALLVNSPFTTGKSIKTAVTTTQVAPTILEALGLDPQDLQAVQKEGTVALPGL